MDKKRYSQPKLFNVNDILHRSRGELYRHANFYKDNLVNKRVTYYFHSKGVPKRRTIYFYERNFMHLCGIRRYPGGWKGFYNDCVNNKLKTSKGLTLQPKYVNAKIQALENLPKILEREFVGFSDGSVVHKSTNYGELVRTQEDLLALGTIEDRSTGNQVPISLINLEVSQDGMRKATSNWCKVADIKVADIPKQAVNTYQEERELDMKMRVKTDINKYKNKQKQRRKVATSKQ